MTVAEFGVFRSDQNVATQKEFESSATAVPFTAPMTGTGSASSLAKTR